LENPINRHSFTTMRVLLCCVTFLTFGATLCKCEPCDELVDSIAPCECITPDQILDCSNIQSGEQLLTIPGLQNGPPIGFEAIRIVNNQLITELPSGSFGHHYATRWYAFTSNPKLTIIDSSIFKPDSATTLEIILLSNNALLSFDFSVVKGFPKLASFWADGNQLTAIPSSSFRGANLYEIRLHNNKISFVGPHAFDNLPGLQLLTLDDNRLTALGADSLAFASRVAHLSLAGNYLGEFSPYFTNMLAEFTQLSSNQVHKLYRTTWEPLLEEFAAALENTAEDGRSISVVFSNNRFECDCDMYWLYQREDLMTLPYLKDTIICADFISLWDISEEFFSGWCASS
jgi:hypothetical protein